MQKYIQILFIILTSFSLVNCLGSDGGSSSNSGSLGSVSVTCSSSSDCADNSADDSSGKAYVAFLTVDCSSFSGSELAAYGATNFSCSSGTCTGTVESWYDSDDSAISLVPSGTTAMFVFLDSNNNGEPDSGEPYQCFDDKTASSGNTSVTVSSDWP